MEEGVYAYNEINCYHQDFSDKVRIRLGGDYEIKVEDGKTYIVKKKPKCPQTYKDCCDILNIPNDERYIAVDVPLDYNKLVSTFTELMICRKAYWKISGEQMGLGKPWEPYVGKNHIKYVIQTVSDKVVCLDTWCQTRNILEFPTAKMRDAFYENFKNLIELCKELL